METHTATGMKDVIFTSYTFDNEAAGGDYRAQQIRLRESILSIYPDANLNFQYEPEHIGKPKFQQSLYGFKVRLVKECLEMGYKKIVFADSALTFCGEIDYWFELIKDYGVLAIGGKQSLDTVISNDLKRYIHKNNRTLSKIMLVGGSIYVFDFDVPKCKKVFDYWADLEERGLFGTQDDLSHGRLGNHRMDETCISISLYLHGVKPMGFSDLNYGYINPSTGKITCIGDEDELTILKKHFK